MMSSLRNFSCIWSSKQTSAGPQINGKKNVLQKISGCSGPGAIIQRLQSVIFHLGNYTSDIFIIKLREDREEWLMCGLGETAEGDIIILVTFPPLMR